MPDESPPSAADNAPIALAAAPEPAVATTRKNKVRIIVSIDPDLLAALDSLARYKGLSRAGTISLACADLIDRGRRQCHG
ncbi:hypothetical protein [Paraburkholderia sacchari]|uniref:hypothetical protein n=1 Tax=Paraburkholderia sacchari TaxID=159450 RepID=UPI001BCAF124|nr:hypothetical protein [Paraburkholderia sacchari]